MKQVIIDLSHKLIKSIYGNQKLSKVNFWNFSKYLFSINEKSLSLIVIWSIGNKKIINKNRYVIKYFLLKIDIHLLKF